jgi:hypothetical protein
MTSDAALDAAAPPLFGYALGNFRTVPFTVMKIHFEIGGIPIARKGYSDSPIKAVFLKIEKKKAKIPVPAKSAIASVRIGPLSPLTFGEEAITFTGRVISHLTAVVHMRHSRSPRDGRDQYPPIKSLSVECSTVLEQ